MRKLDDSWIDFLTEFAFVVAIAAIFGVFFFRAHKQIMAEKDQTTRIHTLEQRIDMHDLRLDKLERIVSGTNFNAEASND